MFIRCHKRITPLHRHVTPLCQLNTTLLSSHHLTLSSHHPISPAYHPTHHPITHSSLQSSLHSSLYTTSPSPTHYHTHHPTLLTHIIRVVSASLAASLLPTNEARTVIGRLAYKTLPRVTEHWQGNATSQSNLFLLGWTIQMPRFLYQLGSIGIETLFVLFVWWNKILKYQYLLMLGDVDGNYTINKIVVHVNDTCIILWLVHNPLVTYYSGNVLHILPQRQ